MGYTSAEGLILTGQGSTSDVTIKNDADATILSIPTGTTTVSLNSTASANVSSGAQTLGIHGEAALYRQEDNAYGRSLTFAKSRGSGVEVVEDDDALGYICWAGADGTDLATCGAMIHGEVDGTPGSNDMPGRLIFSTINLLCKYGRYAHRNYPSSSDQYGYAIVGQDRIKQWN